MPKLTVNPDSEAAWEIELQPGEFSLGSGAENSIPIEHPSVSSAHCLVTVADSGVTVRDLGSVNGTFVNNTLVEEAILLPGQILRLGDVQMRLEDEQQAGVAVTSAPSAIRPAAARTVCKNHPKAVARYYCSHCKEALCELCVNTRMASGRPTRFCRVCNNECVSTQPEVKKVTPSFVSQIGGAFAYPFRGSGPILLVGGVIFLLVLALALRLAGFAGPYGFVVGLIIGVFLVGYVFSYAKSIITSTANGDSDPPDWPDFTNWQQDVVLPFFQCLALVVLSFGPAIILKWWHPFGESYAHAIQLLATGWGAVFAPMGMLALAMFDTVGALNPVALIWSIARVPLSYLMAAGIFEFVFVLNSYAASFIHLLPVPILPGVLVDFLGLYFAVVGMRILGLLYWTKKDKLRWFRT